MKKKRLWIAVLVVILAGAILAAVLIRNRESRRLEITMILEKGNRCEVTVGDEDVVRYVECYSLNEKEDFDDGKEHINFVFEGLNEGRTTVSIKCIDSTEDKVLTEEIFKVKVTKTLDTSIYILEK